VAYVSVLIAVLALLFTVASFWWLQARTGKVTAATPSAYAFASKPRLRVPLAFFNDCARPLLISDLRIVILEGGRDPLQWVTTRKLLRPEEEDGFSYKTPFAVPGRGTREVIAEFGDNAGWSPEPESKWTFQLQAHVHPSEEWIEVTTSSWWAPGPEADLARYIAYSNEPEISRRV
jgi:hypothetical protein